MPGEGCPPPVPDEIIGCSLDYFDEIVIPYAAYAIEYQNEDINCPLFIELVGELESRYINACASSGD